MRFEGVEFHNIATTNQIADRGVRLQRVPEDVRTQLNEHARERMLRPAGAEIRFVSDSHRVEVTLATTGRTTIDPYWGPFRGSDPIVLENGQRTLELTYPATLNALHDDVASEFQYDPSVWRLVLNGDPITFHEIDGEGIRPPPSSALPDRTYLAYGTSITEGAAATGPHLTYVRQAASRIGADAVNLGSGGSAYCEPVIADYIAGRDDWDVATLAVSVNMFSAGFSVEQFRDRVRYLVETVAETGRPVVCISLFPFAHDISDAERYADAVAEPEAFRSALRAVVENAQSENVRLVSGTDLLADVGGLSPDLTHPSDHGMIAIGERLSRELRTAITSSSL